MKTIPEWNGNSNSENSSGIQSLDCAVASAPTRDQQQPDIIYDSLILLLFLFSDYDVINTYFFTIAWDFTHLLETRQELMHYKPLMITRWLLAAIL